MRTYFIPFYLADRFEDAELLAPNWVRAIVKVENGWLCFESKPATDVWFGYDHL